jgi:hypothetical protein
MENSESGLNKLTDTIENVITGVPVPVRKNLYKVVDQLFTAVIDIPVAVLEGKADEIRATTQARVELIRKVGGGISDKIQVPQEYSKKASIKYADKVIKEQLNLDEITFNAVSELSSNKQLQNGKADSEDISEDWLNEFENLARLKSSEDMKLVFGKILAGEIVKPGTFSIKTIHLISQLDNQAAKLFQAFCSQAISLRVADNVFDARVVSISGTAQSNSLSEFGLSFGGLNILHEYGLITPDYNSYMGYSSCIANEQMQLKAALRFQNKDYGLVPSNSENFDKTLNLHGVALTKSGEELLDIIPLNKADDYKEKLIEFFKSKYLDLVEIK